MKKTYAEQIADLEATRAAKASAADTIMQKAIGEGRSTDTAEGEEIDTINGEIEALDKDLVRLKAMEKNNAYKATPVVLPAAAADLSGAASQTRGGAHVLTLKNQARNGLALAQFVKCLYKGEGNKMQALQIAEADKGIDPRVINVIKATIAAGSTAVDAWAGALVGDETSVYADFLEYLRPTTILGKFGNNGVPSLRTVPFRVPLVGQTSGGSGYWVGEGKGKPLTSFDFSRTTLEPLKVANIAVLTMEVLRDSSPSADAIVRDQLVAALRERLDIDFINPWKAASAGVSPASISFGITPIASSGMTADAVRADIKAIFSAFIAANNAPTSGVWIMKSVTALSLSLMLNPLGQPEFGGITMNGGTFFGLPVITSEYVPAGSDGDLVFLVNAQDIYLGDEGGFMVDMSREASLEMSDTPTQSSVTTVAATSLVSLWQTNSVGFRAERTINWKRRRDSAVAFLEGVNWGEGS